MHALIYEPFNSPDIISYADSAISTSAPILVVLEEVIRAYELYWAEFEKSIQKESDVVTLEAARIVLELSGVLRKYKGRFIIGRDFRDAIKKHGVGGVYRELFRAAMLRYNWAYLDQMDLLPQIQGSANFTLRLLARYGDEPRPATFYSDAFIRAFPLLVDEAVGMPESPWDTPSSNLAQLYIRRTFNHFGHTMGLVHNTFRPGHDLLTPDIIEAAPLLREFVRFHA